MVCGWSAYWPHGTRFINTGQQNFWRQLLIATYMRSMHSG